MGLAAGGAGLLGTLLSGVGQIAGMFGGGNDSPSPPPPAEIPAPPPAPVAERGKSADSTIAEEAQRMRDARRRKTETRPSVTKLVRAEGKKSLLGE